MLRLLRVLAAGVMTVLLLGAGLFWLAHSLLSRGPAEPSASERCGQLVSLPGFIRMPGTSEDRQSFYSFWFGPAIPDAEVVSSVTASGIALESTKNPETDGEWVELGKGTFTAAEWPFTYVAVTRLQYAPSSRDSLVRVAKATSAQLAEIEDGSAEMVVISTGCMGR